MLSDALRLPGVPEFLSDDLLIPGVYNLGLIQTCSARSLEEARGDFLIPSQSDSDRSAESPRALIFDCDGTLADTMPIHFVAWRETMSKFGIEFPETRFYELGGVPTEEIIRLLSREQGVELDVDEASAQKESAFLRHLPTVGPVEPILAIAREHRGKLPMAVGSGSCRGVLHKTLKQLEIFDWFDAIVSADDTERHKPEPDVFLLGAELLGVQPEDCCVYEDTDIGLQAARAAGMQWVDVRPMYIPRNVD